VLFLCFEDGLPELKRRIKAALLHHGINTEDIRGWLFYQTLNGAAAKLLKMSPFGQRVPGQLGAWLREIITRLGVELIIFDPFIKTHAVPENDNSAIDEVVSMFVQIGIDCQIAVDFLHQTKAKSNQVTPTLAAAPPPAKTPDASSIPSSPCHTKTPKASA